MIIGNGLIASLFKDIDQTNVIYFASGVSNSAETDPLQFKREEDLIRKTMTENPDDLFVYFSTCSMYDSSKNNSAYVLHKHKMEELIMQSTSSYLILRVSNAVGKGGNPNLLMNYLVRSLKEGQSINVHTKATRNLIDVEDIKNITLELVASKDYNKIINIAFPENYSITELVTIVENFFGLKTAHKMIPTGSGYQISIPEVENYFIKKQLINKESYLCRILEKYYS